MVKHKTKKSPQKQKKSYRTGHGGLKHKKRFNWKRNIFIVLAVALVGGFAVYRSFAGNQVTIPSEFIARTYTEGLGRVPTQTEWNKWHSYFQTRPCNTLSLSGTLAEVYFSDEYKNLPYSADARTFTIYRGVLSREPDSGGFAYWKRRIETGTSIQTVLSSMAQSSEFKRLAGVICGSNNYPVKGVPFKITSETSGQEVQKRIDAARPGSTVYLPKSQLIRLSEPLLIKRGVTLATQDSAGLSGRMAYANMARTVASDSTAITAAPVVVMPGGSLRNVWVDGRMWQRGTKENGKNNIRVFPTASTATVQHVRTENTTGAQNVMVFGIVGNEYTRGTGRDYLSDVYCSGTVNVTGNLVINSANLRTSDKWSDGIATSCPQTQITSNDVLDASDVGIITYRSYGALPQRSQIVGNNIINAGSSVFGGLVADPLSLRSQQMQPYPDCMKHESSTEPHCDFTGLSFRDNTLWSGPDQYYAIGVSVGTRAWSFFKPDAVTGSGASFTNNSNRGSVINVLIPLYVSGMHNATVTNNFTHGKVTNRTQTVTKCAPSAVQLYNPTFASNLNPTNQLRAITESNPKFIAPVTTATDRDKCI